MLPKEDSKSVVVKKFYRRLKGIWGGSMGRRGWVRGEGMVIRRELCNVQRDSACRVGQAASMMDKVLGGAIVRGTPPFTFPTTTSPNYTLPDSDNRPAQPHASLSPTNTHCPPSLSCAENNPPPPSPPNSALSVPSDHFLEGTPTLLGGPPSGPVSQE